MSVEPDLAGKARESRDVRCLGRFLFSKGQVLNG